jgi:hypothetical protein
LGLQEKNWRFGYAKHVVENVRLCCKSAASCTKVAQAGLDYCYDNFEFVRGDKTYTLRNAMTEIKVRLRVIWVLSRCPLVIIVFSACVCAGLVCRRG